MLGAKIDSNGPFHGTSCSFPYPNHCFSCYRLLIYVFVRISSEGRKVRRFARILSLNYAPQTTILEGFVHRGTKDEMWMFEALFEGVSKIWATTH